MYLKDDRFLSVCWNKYTRMYYRSGTGGGCWCICCVWTHQVAARTPSWNYDVIWSDIRL